MPFFQDFQQDTLQEHVGFSFKGHVFGSLVWSLSLVGFYISVFVEFQPSWLAAKSLAE